MSFSYVQGGKEHDHQFIILNSSLRNGNDVYHVKTRNTKAFFRVTLDKMLSDTHLLFGLPPAQSCSIAIDAYYNASSDHNIYNKIELAQYAAWRVLASVEAKTYPFIILGYGEKSQIKFKSDRQKKHKEYAVKLIRNNIICQFNPPSAFIIGCIAALHIEKSKRTPHLRLIV